MSDTLKDQALQYHAQEPPGKLQIVATKPMATQHDLSLAYSPGVAYACEAIAADPIEASRLTGRGNLVAVISNGTAVLGLGNIGALASKPVMEGKAVLFKRFSGIDVFDVEVDETEIDSFCEAVARLGPTFGGINLEDIKAPECFEIEKRLRARMDIPVFHDDQHGTAIVTAAAVLNGLDLVDKRLEDVRIVCNGAGAAALACLDLLVAFGARKKNVIVCDRSGVVHSGRAEQMDRYKAAYASETDRRTLSEALDGADIFLGVSAGKVVTAEMVAAMAPKPLILAMANPEPEIRPELVKTVRDDAIIATGRSDYPNQVNNVLCFPFIFRGALDVGATAINEAMKKACAEAIARIARAEASDVVLTAYGVHDLSFGPEYIIPKPFDPRLMLEIAPAVAQAAMDSGVAARPIEDLAAYRQRLTRLVYRSGMLMEPVFEKAQRDPKRVLYGEGESERVLQAAQQAVDEGIARPVLIGRRNRIQSLLKSLGLRLTIDETVEVIEPDDSSWTGSVEPEPSTLAWKLLKQGVVHTAICGTNGYFQRHLDSLSSIIGKAYSVKQLSTINALVLPAGTVFIADTYITPDPSSDQIADLTILAAETMRRFGVAPRVAVLSHSNFGDRDTPSAQKMRDAVEILRSREPDFEVDGEMHGDAALSAAIRARTTRESRLSADANLLIMPNLDAAHIAMNLLKTMGGGVSVGPILLGAACPAHIVSRSITVRGLLNMTAVAVVDAQRGV